MADGSISQGLRSILGKEVFGPVKEEVSVPVDEIERGLGLGLGRDESQMDIVDGDKPDENLMVETPIEATESADSHGASENVTDGDVAEVIEDVHMDQEGHGDNPDEEEEDEVVTKNLHLTSVEEGEEEEEEVLMEEGEEMS